MNRRAVILLSILVVALTARLLFLSDLKESPYWDNLMIDAASYDRWAQEIAKGDILGNQVFYQSPLYPYFLGSTYAVFGRDFLAARVVQSIIGSITCLLLALVTMRVFSNAAGVIAGFVAALYGTFIFQDLMLLKSVIVLFFLSLAFLRMTSAGSRPGPVFAAGILYGIAICGRGNLLFGLPILAVWFAIRNEQAPFGAGGWRLGLIFLVGAFLAISPVTIRNWMVGDDWVLTESDAGINLYVGNNPNATGIHTPPSEVRTVPEHEEVDAKRLAELTLGRELKPSEVSRFWIDRAIAFALSEPIDEGKLIGKKFLLAWNRYEVPDNYDQYYFARVSPLFRGMLPSFFLIAPFSMVGMIVSFKDWRRTGFLMIFTLAYLFSLLVLYVTSRYRLPIVVGLIPFAAHGGVVLFSAFRERSRNGIVLAGIAIATALISAAPVIQPQGFSKQETEVATFHAMNGRFDEAESAFLRAIDEASSNESGDIHLVYLNQGFFYCQFGRNDLAVAAFRNALRANPSFAPAQKELDKLERSPSHSPTG